MFGVMQQANAWRRTMVARLVAACRQEEGQPIEVAARALKVHGSRPVDTGFSVADLRYYRAVLLDRADEIETRVAFIAARHEGAKSRAERLLEKCRRVGGTVSRAEFARYRDEAHEAAAIVERIAADLADESCEADALRGAAALIADALDARTATRVQAIRSVTVEVEA